MGSHPSLRSLTGLLTRFRCRVWGGDARECGLALEYLREERR